jgi:hypothetical protein
MTFGSAQLEELSVRCTHDYSAAPRPPGPISKAILVVLGVALPVLSLPPLPLPLPARPEQVLGRRLCVLAQHRIHAHDVCFKVEACAWRVPPAHYAC